MYTSPARTLFEYQRQLAARGPDAPELWVTGTVPRGATCAAQAAWARYESAVNEALGALPVPGAVHLRHPHRVARGHRHGRARHTRTSTRSSAACRARTTWRRLPSWPTPWRRCRRHRGTAPTLSRHVGGLDDVLSLRNLVRRAGRSATAMPFDAIEALILAVHEVTANGIVHGAPPVWVELWTELDAMVVEVLDAGPGGLDPMTGYRYPDALGTLGLWVARQEVDDLIIDTPPGGGCRVLLFMS